MIDGPQLVQELVSISDSARAPTSFVNHALPTPALSRKHSVDTDAQCGSSDSSSDAGGAPDTPSDFGRVQLPPQGKIAHSEPIPSIADLGAYFLAMGLPFTMKPSPPRPRARSISCGPRSPASSRVDEEAEPVEEKATPLVDEPLGDTTKDAPEDVPAAAPADTATSSTAVENDAASTRASRPTPVPQLSLTAEDGTTAAPPDADSTPRPDAYSTTTRARPPLLNMDFGGNYAVHSHAHARAREERVMHAMLRGDYFPSPASSVPSSGSPSSFNWQGEHPHFSHLPYGGGAPTLYAAPHGFVGAAFGPPSPFEYTGPYQYYAPHGALAVPWPGAPAHSPPRSPVPPHTQMPAPAPPAPAFVHVPRRTHAPRPQQPSPELFECRTRPACAPGTQARLPDVPDSNQLDIAAVEAGHDPRTTVMIKNVPNRMSAEDLLDFIMDVVPGEIDFFYLRMDFSNGCNVGYAFVNFSSVESLLKFARKKLSTPWAVYQSRKVVQMSYANYQGKPALVDKFKNSAIMDQPEEWRPRIFYSDGELRGQPEPFPRPTHMRRKERSSANMQTLYSGGGRGRAPVRPVY